MLLKLLIAAQEVIEPELGNAIQDREEVASAFNGILSRMWQKLNQTAIGGSAASFESGVRFLLRLRLAEKRTRAWLEGLYVDRGTLSPEVQNALSDLLEVSDQSSSDIELHTGLTASVQAVQLASALIRSWIASSTTPQAKEAFEELASVLHGFFHIEIKGEVGEVTTFNPVVHELIEQTGSQPADVRVLRPRVESSDGAITTVLIKALVEPSA